MDVHVGQLTASVRAVDDRTLLSPEVLEEIVRQVLQRLEQQRSSERTAREDARLWSSVREDAP